MSSFVLFALLLSFGCASNPYNFSQVEEVPFALRAQEQAQDDIRVRVAVPSAEETEAIFGIPMYAKKIQPVWVEVTNGTASRLRFAPTGVDRNYFSPLEVPYMYKSGFSKEARRQIDRRFYQLAMPRRIEAGETVSGFVFTNLSPGTKRVKIDLFGPVEFDYSFAFFVNVPGFEPDHASIDFEHLYAEDEMIIVDNDGLHAALTDLPCCTTGDEVAEPGLPYNVVLVGNGVEILHALLRSGWHETQRADKVASAEATEHQYFGRSPDAIFRRARSGPAGAFSADERIELRVWRAPIVAEDDAVWVTQLVRYVGPPTAIERFILGAHLDPDLDDSRDFLWQLSWYAQSLERYGWLDGGQISSVESPKTDWRGDHYFTDGRRVVLWLTGDPQSLLEAEDVGWSATPKSEESAS